MYHGYNTYYCTDHDHFNPVGCASIVNAVDKRTARKKLKRALKERGLDEKMKFTLTRLRLGETIILQDGEY